MPPNEREKSPQGLLGKQEICMLVIFAATAATAVGLFSVTLSMMVQVKDATKDTTVRDGIAANVSELQQDFEDLSELKRDFEDLKKKTLMFDELAKYFMLGFTFLRGRTNESTAILFKKFNDPVNFMTAEAKCEQINCTLAMKVMRNPDLLKQVIENTVSMEKTWFGYTDRENEGEWKWLDNSTENGTLEWNTPPDNYKNNEDCVNIVRSDENDILLLNDIPCNANDMVAYLCEKELSYIV